jgi:hypothetical protein
MRTMNVDGKDVQIQVNKCGMGYTVTTAGLPIVGYGTTVSSASYHFYTLYKGFVSSQSRPHETA